MNTKIGKAARQLMAVVLAIAVAAIVSNHVDTVTSAAMLKTEVAFSTPPGALEIPIRPGARRLATVDVSDYRQIRVVAAERVGSPTNVRIKLLTVHSASAFLDTLELTPQSSITRVYDVPGVRVEILVETLGTGTGSDFIDLTIFGSE